MGTDALASKILVVDDERNLVELVRGYLQAEGYQVVVAYDGLRALELARSEQPDLIVLDVMLPGLDGIEVCRRIRQFSEAYVLMLTARSEEIDKVVGLSVGADDYLTKPFSPRELVARVKAMLRRLQSSRLAPVLYPSYAPIPSTLPAPPVSTDPAGARDTPAPLVFGDLVIDEDAHRVTLRGEEVRLTPREFGLLSILASHPGRVFTRDQLLEQVWGDEYYGDHVVDVRITHLRKKLEEDPTEPLYIETVRGVGYRFRQPENIPGHNSERTPK
jgi:DNA-binding response OmpR family regulator